MHVDRPIFIVYLFISTTSTIGHGHTLKLDEVKNDFIVNISSGQRNGILWTHAYPQFRICPQNRICSLRVATGATKLCRHSATTSCDRMWLICA